MAYKKKHYYEDNFVMNHYERLSQDFEFASGYTGKATAVITFTDTPNDASTITLVDSDGTSATFEIDNENNGVTSGNIAVNNIAASGGGGTGTATDLAAKINASSLSITATQSSATLTLTSDVIGIVGNTTISYNNYSHWNGVTSNTLTTEFAGGSRRGVPFSYATKGIRLRINPKAYKTHIG